MCAPGTGALKAKVLYSPDKGKSKANGKGIPGDWKIAEKTQRKR